MTKETKNEVTELQGNNQEQVSLEEINAEDKKSFTKYRVERAEKNKEKEILLQNHFSALFSDMNLSNSLSE